MKAEAVEHILSNSLFDTSDPEEEVAMSAIQVKVPSFEYGDDSKTLGQRWAVWVERFMLALGANGLNHNNNNQASKNKDAFLIAMGDQPYAQYKLLKTGDDQTLDQIIKFMGDYYKQEASELFERVSLIKTHREPNESIDAFVNRLRLLSSRCGWTSEVNDMIIQMVLGANCEMIEVTRKMCAVGKLPTLAESIATAKEIERLAACTSGLSLGIGSAAATSTRHEINFTSRGGHKGGSAQHHQQKRGGSGQQQAKLCATYCGQWHPPGPANCPAYGHACKKCSRQHHFEHLCQNPNQGASASPSSDGDSAQRSNTKHDSSKNVSFSGASNGPKSNSHSKQRGGGGMKRSVSFVAGGAAAAPTTSGHRPANGSANGRQSNEQLDAQFAQFCRFQQGLMFDDDDDYSFNLVTKSNARRRSGPTGARVEVDACGGVIDMLIDTGAPYNIIDEPTYGSLKMKQELSRCTTPWFGFNSKEPLPMLGQFITEVSFNGVAARAAFLVVAGPAECLMSYNTAVALGVVVINNRKTNPVVWDEATPSKAVGRGDQEEQCPENQQGPEAQAQEQPDQAGAVDEPDTVEGEEQEAEQDEQAAVSTTLSPAAPAATTVAVAPVVTAAPAKRGPGRLCKADQAIRDAEVERRQEERRMLNPPKRSSTRNKPTSRS